MCMHAHAFEMWLAGHSHAQISAEYAALKVFNLVLNIIFQKLLAKELGIEKCETVLLRMYGVKCYVCVVKLNIFTFI